MAAKVFSGSTKMMLQNIIRHTNSHNKVVEESDMWQQFERMKGMGGLSPSNPSYGHDDRCTSRRHDNRSRASRQEERSQRGSRAAHMDEEARGGQSGVSRSTYWSRQLEKAETADPNRWDHSGFRELYPNDFDSDRSDRSRSRSLGKKRSASSKRKKKRKKEKKGKRVKSKDKRRRHKHQKERRRRESSSSSSSDSDSSADHAECGGRRRKSRVDGTRPPLRSDSDSSHSSQSISPSPRKRHGSRTPSRKRKSQPEARRVRKRSRSRSSRRSSDRQERRRREEVYEKRGKRRSPAKGEWVEAPRPRPFNGETLSEPSHRRKQWGAAGDRDHSRSDRGDRSRSGGQGVRDSATQAKRRRFASSSSSSSDSD